LPAGIVKLSSKYLTNPERISAGSTTDAAPNIKQELIHTNDSEKYSKLLEQLAAHKGSTIIFVKTKYGTEKLADKLSKQNYQSDAIHGDLRQSRRDKVIQGFRDKKFRVLVATDLAARGLDVPHIELVINYDLPQCPEDYIHRIGRTARAGAHGKAINFLTSADRQKWNAIHRLMNPNAPRTHEPREESSGNRRRGFGGRGGKPNGSGGSGGYAGNRSEGHRDGGQRDGGQRDGQRDHKPGGGAGYAGKRRSFKPRGERSNAA
jgi:superfamily II DNA/RNA helicase